MAPGNKQTIGEHAMRTFIYGIAALGLTGLAAVATAQTAEDAFGTWKHPENGSHVDVYKCGDGLCAKISKVTDGQKTDDKNPDAGKKSRSIIGLNIMSGAKKTGANAWKGSLYNRADGGTYSGTLTVTSKKTMDLSGCTAAIFCKTTTWTRVN
jgi:uncharacterized protein (DUF2147 family)